MFVNYADSRDDDDDDVFTDEPPSTSYESNADAFKSAKQRSQSLSALPKDDKSPKKVFNIISFLSPLYDRDSLAGRASDFGPRGCQFETASRPGSDVGKSL